MSETVLDHGYVPEEHAPDPVISHGDPTPPGKVAIWLFLASEVMFFIAILGSYIILRSGSHVMFATFAQLVLSKKLEVKRIIAGPGVFICNECIQIFTDTLANE